MFCSSCGGKCPSIANFCHQCGQQLNLSQVSNKAASSIDKEKLLKEYFHRGYPCAAIVSLLGKRHGVRMHVRVLKRKLKNRPRKLRPVRQRITHRESGDMESFYQCSTRYLSSERNDFPHLASHAET